MNSFSNIVSLQNELKDRGLEGKTIGLVPTMGALHDGHISLIEKAGLTCDFVIVSVFVNPTQFNSLEDLDKYPRTIEEDIKKLRMTSCDTVFIPEISDVYPDFKNTTEFVQVDLGALDSVMEGVQRPGHFKGVINVVYRLFDIVKPNKAFFGEKDFQQIAVIRKMVEETALLVEIVTCETLREESGLAMSSRNVRLSERGKEEARVIYQTLLEARTWATIHTPREVKKMCEEKIKASTLSLEYISIAEPILLDSLYDDWVPGARCFIVAHCENVRLIDNIKLID